MSEVVAPFTNLFSTPNPPAASPSPKSDTAPVQQVASETSQRRARARGYRSTILSQLMPANAPALKDTFGA
jgi:hypothetical protein